MLSCNQRRNRSTGLHASIQIRNPLLHQVWLQSLIYQLHGGVGLLIPKLAQRSLLARYFTDTWIPN